MVGQHLLTDRLVKSTDKDGRHSDGGGLYLVVKRGWKGWAFISQAGGKRREIGLGSYPLISLAEAREQALKARKAVRDGLDPRSAVRPEKREVPTFGPYAQQIAAGLEANFRNAKHREQWRNTLRDYCAPIAGKCVDEITTRDVHEVLKPIWHDKPETASRLRGRIERVLAAAIATGLRAGPNPAAWKDNLEPLLGKRKRLTRGHHRALPYEQVPALMARLRANAGMTARCLEFLILTAARSGEAFGARWSEIDLDAAVWTIPGERMKAGRVHRVPLCGRAIEIVRELAIKRTGDYVFPGRNIRGPLSSMALAMLMRDLKVDATVHGFRSAFRDWTEEQTSTPHAVAEAALAHTVTNKVEAAYRRTDLFERRRVLMDQWEAYCSRLPSAE
jgi:integrase